MRILLWPNISVHNTTIFDCVTKMMPFDTNMFCPRTKLIRLVCKFETSSVVFKKQSIDASVYRHEIDCQEEVDRGHLRS